MSLNIYYIQALWLLKQVYPDFIANSQISDGEVVLKNHHLFPPY